MKKLFAVMFVASMAWPLGGCLDGVTDNISDIASAGTDSVLEKVDNGLDAAEAAQGSKIDAWADQHVADTQHDCSGDQHWNGTVCVE